MRWHGLLLRVPRRRLQAVRLRGKVPLVRIGAVRATTGETYVNDTQAFEAFDPSNLKPGDAVSIEHYGEHGWVAWDEGRVVAVHDDGVIELEDDQRFGPDGRKQFTSLRYRLRPPTDGV